MKKTFVLLLLVAATLMVSAQTFRTYSRSHGIGVFGGGFMLPNHAIVDQWGTALTPVDYNASRVSPHLGLQYSSFRSGTGLTKGYTLYASYGTHVFRGTVADTAVYLVDNVSNRISFGLSYSLGYNFDDVVVLLGGIGWGSDVLVDKNNSRLKSISTYFLVVTGRYILSEHFYLQADASMGLIRNGFMSNFFNANSSFTVGDRLSCYLTDVHPLRLNIGVGYLF